MTITIVWYATQRDANGWDWGGCLYAYLHPQTRAILYIGKADSTTVGDRFDAPDKKNFWVWAKRHAGASEVEVLVGMVQLEANQRLTAELLADIESLLIFQIQPPGNVASTQSRTRRPGMRVRCQGQAWPLTSSTYVDA